MTGRPAYRRVLRGGKFVVLGNAAAAGLGLLLLFLLARTLPPEGLAVVVAIVAVIDGGQMFLDATVNTGMINLASRDGKEGAPDASLLRGGFWTKLILGIAFAATIALASGALSNALVGDGSIRWLIVAAGCAGAIAGLHGFVLAVLTAREEFVTLAAISPLKNALRIAAVAPFLLFDAPSQSAAALAICATTVPLLVAGALTIPWRFLSEGRALRDSMWRLIGVNGWLLLSALAMLGGRLDVWLVGWLSSARDAGLFALAAQLCVGVGVVTQAMVTAFLPTVSRLRTSDEFTHFLRRAAVVGGPLLLLPILAWPLAAPVLGLVFGPEYAQAAGIFVILFLASVMSLIGAPLMLTLLSIGEARIVAVASVFQLALRIALATLFVPVLGGTGMAGADVLSRLIAMALIGGVILSALRRPRAANAGILTEPGDA